MSCDASGNCVVKDFFGNVVGTAFLKDGLWRWSFDYTFLGQEYVDSVSFFLSDDGEQLCSIHEGVLECSRLPENLLPYLEELFPFLYDQMVN